MNKPIILDAGPLGRIAHPRPKPEIALWLEQMLADGVEVIIPEIADYQAHLARFFSPASLRYDPASF